MADKYLSLPIDQLQTNPFQPRDKIKKETILDLAESIKVHGILEPLVVAQTPAGFQIIAGERRWRAAKLAGLTKVPALIKTPKRKDMLSMAVVENLQRTNLNPIEKAQSFAELKKQFGMSNLDIAKRIGKSPSFVSKALACLKLPDAIKDALAADQITEGHIRAISSLPEEYMMKAFRQIVKEGGSVRRAEELARYYRQSVIDPDQASKVRSIKAGVIPEAKIQQWQAALKAKIKSMKKLKFTRSSTQTKIAITLKGNLVNTQGDLEKIMKLIVPADD